MENKQGIDHWIFYLPNFRNMTTKIRSTGIPPTSLELNLQYSFSSLLTPGIMLQGMVQGFKNMSEGLLPNVIFAKPSDEYLKIQGRLLSEMFSYSNFSDHNKPMMARVINWPRPDWLKQYCYGCGYTFARSEENSMMEILGLPKVCKYCDIKESRLKEML